MKNKIYYRESRLFYLVYLVVFTIAIVANRPSIWIILTLSIFVTTVIQNETKPKEHKRARK